MRLLWIDDFYDGPIAGIAEVDGARVLFEMIDRGLLGSETGPRTFWVIHLDSTQLAEEERWHELFCKFVGTHSDCTERERSLSPASEHHLFYDSYSKRHVPNYSENEVLGWFQIGLVD